MNWNRGRLISCACWFGLIHWTTGDFWFLIPARIYSSFHAAQRQFSTPASRNGHRYPPSRPFSCIPNQPWAIHSWPTSSLRPLQGTRQVSLFSLPPIISSPDVVILEFLISLQTLAADKTLSQPERLMASLITGRELKTKWRSKAYVPCWENTLWSLELLQRPVNPKLDEGFSAFWKKKILL